MLLIVAGAMNAICFAIGAKIGQKTKKNEPIEFRNLNPLNVIKEEREKADAKKEQSLLEVLDYNIGIYNGTPSGQKDLPR